MTAKSKMTMTAILERLTKIEMDISVLVEISDGQIDPLEPSIGQVDRELARELGKLHDPMKEEIEAHRKWEKHSMLCELCITKGPGKDYLFCGPGAWLYGKVDEARRELDGVNAAFKMGGTG